MLHRRALTAEHREREHAAHNSYGAQHTGKGDFFCIGFHFGSPFSFVYEHEKAEEAPPDRAQPPHGPTAPRVTGVHGGRSKLAGFLSRRNTASHRGRCKGPGRSPSASGFWWRISSFPQKIKAGCDGQPCKKKTILSPSYGGMIHIRSKGRSAALPLSRVSGSPVLYQVWYTFGAGLSRGACFFAAAAV